MNFNTFLTRFGISPDNFKNAFVEPIPIKEGFLYIVEQRTDERTCPGCGNEKTRIKGYYYTETNCSETDQITDVLRIKRVRFSCPNCNVSFSPAITGIARYSKTSNQTLLMIYNDFSKSLTFSQIAQRYGMTCSRIIQIFDEKVRFIPPRKLPEALCIDEIHFAEELNQKYCCVLYDFNKRTIVDIIKNRQMAYLDEYFSKIPAYQRETVKYFISDMYDGYSTVRKRYFPGAIHIVDLFHVITQLTQAVNRIRVNTMVRNAEKGSVEYNFMKTHWKEFLKRREDVSDRIYSSRTTGYEYHYDDLINRCIRMNNDFLTAYNCLQDLYHYGEKTTYTEAEAFVTFMYGKLLLSDNELLVQVGRTYKKWRVEIANGIARNHNKIRYTNAIAESLNNQLKTIIKSAYGFHNFERFRKRAMMILPDKSI